MQVKYAWQNDKIDDFIMKNSHPKCLFVLGSTSFSVSSSKTGFALPNRFHILFPAFEQERVQILIVPYAFL